MATATFQKFNDFIEAVFHKKHDLSSDTLKLAFCATANAPTAAASVLTDLTVIVSTNWDSITVTTASSGQTSGTYTCVLTDKLLTATGDVPAFRYVVLYNDDATNDDLIGFLDYGETIEASIGEQLLVDFPASAITAS